jgi:predicted naringenin-chalcone synthase
MRVYKENALPLAMAAIKACLAQTLHVHPNTITHLITVSCTGMYAPGIDIEIVQQLKLNSNVKRTCINFMGCYGAFNAIKMADTVCQSDQKAKVLVVSVELCTIHFQKNDTLDSMISNAIFSDGAAAVVVEAAAPAQAKSFLLNQFHCDLLPQHSGDMTWHISDSGFDIVLSSYVPQAIQSGIAEFTERLLQQQDSVLSDIDFFAIHPGGYKILKACETALKITEKDNHYSYDVLRQYGNMSSATVLFVLKKIWDDIGSDDINKKIFSCAFGPGLTLESMLLQVGNSRVD